MACNKFIYNGQTKIDLTQDNVTQSDVLSGKIFHNAAGEQKTGNIVTRSASSETISSAKTYNAGYYPNGWTVTPSGGGGGTPTIDYLGVTQYRMYRDEHPTQYINISSLSDYNYLLFISIRDRYAEGEYNAIIPSEDIPSPDYGLWTVYQQRPGMLFTPLDKFIEAENIDFMANGSNAVSAWYESDTSVKFTIYSEPSVNDGVWIALYGVN